MKYIFILFFASTIFVSAQHRPKEELDKLIVLNEFKVRSAGVKTAEPSSSKFETTLFAIGRIETIPSNRTVVSSRIEGRAVSKPPIVGDYITKGETVFKVESRQPGSPPPVIPIVANGSGIVFESHVNNGQPVSPSEELMDIIDISQVWAVANIPENRAAAVKIGQPARIRISAIGSTVFTGELIKFGTQANSQTGTVQAIFLIDNPENTIRPGMRTEFHIVTKSRNNVLSIPKSAQQGDQLNRHVYRADWELDYAFEKINILTGEENDTHVEILSQDGKDGIVITDEIVTEGAYFLAHSTADKASLKEALDAAHGHEHNEDGSEMTAAQEAKKAGTSGVEGNNGKYFYPLIISNGILILTLCFTIFRKKDIA